MAPPCRHFKSCGGCQLQHASDRFVAAWKTDVIAQALAAQGIRDRYPTHRDLARAVAPPGHIRRAPDQEGRDVGFHGGPRIR